MRRGASVVSCDLGVDELEGVRAIVAAMAQDDEIPDGVGFIAVNGDATALPFPDASFERVIASEVVEHIPDDGAGIRRTGSRAQARRHAWPSRFPHGSPSASVGRCPTTTRRPTLPGGHVRIYSRADAARTVA